VPLPLRCCHTAEQQQSRTVKQSCRTAAVCCHTAVHCRCRTAVLWCLRRTAERQSRIRTAEQCCHIPAVLSHTPAALSAGSPLLQEL